MIRSFQQSSRQTNPVKGPTPPSKYIPQTFTDVAMILNGTANFHKISLYIIRSFQHKLFIEGNFT